MILRCDDEFENDMFDEIIGRYEDMMMNLKMSQFENVKTLRSLCLCGEIQNCNSWLICI